MEVFWEVCALKYEECRTRLSIRGDSKYRNTYCVVCGTAHLWEREDSKEFDERERERKEKN